MKKLAYFTTGSTKKKPSIRLRYCQLVVGLFYFSIPLMGQTKLIKEDSTSHFSNPTALCQYYLREAKKYFKNSEETKIRLSYVDKAIVLAESLKDKSLMAHGHFIRGKILTEMQPQFDGDFINGKLSPVEDLLVALDLSNQIHDHPLTSDIFSSLSTYYYWSEDFDIAASYAQQHIIFMEKHQLNDDTPYAVLGFIYGEQRDFDMAFYYFHKRTKVLKNTGKEKYLAGAMSDIGNMFYAAENYDSARYYYLEGLKISEKYDDQVSMSFLEDNIGLTYQKKGSFALAITWFLKALEHRRNEQWLVGEIVTMNHLGETYLMMGLPRSAKIILRESFPSAQKYNELEFLESTSHLLGMAYQQLQQPDSAYYFLNLSYEYQKELWNLEKTRGIRSSLGAVELENEKLKSELLRADYLQLLLISIVVILSLSLFMLYFYFRSRKNKWERGLAESERNAEISKRETLEMENKLKLNEMKQKEESLKRNIDSLNREMISYSHTIANKNETFTQINQYLVELASANNMTLSKREIEKLSRLITGKIDDESDWLIFIDNFNLVHPQFFSSLKKNHPKLTVHDLRHCAYLYMNLPSGEIAKIMNISMESLRNARVRLRKRLGLDNSVRLEQYLHELLNTEESVQVG